jgi:hypothetical protein
MVHPPSTPEARFAAIVQGFRGNPDVTPPSDEPESKKGFGASGLKVHNRVFAMLIRGSLVVKLSKQRVNTLLAAGDGEPFEPRRDGRFAMAGS